MKPTTAARFGLGKSFQAPSAAPAVVGAALIASGTSDTAETAWSPAAACLLPDILPVAGTLLSYGGDRQLAAGGTVTHSVHTASTKGLILKTTDDSIGQPIFEVQNSIGSSLHRIQGSTAYFANVSVASGLTGTMVNVGSTGYVQWGSRSVAYAPAVGQFSFRNIDETAGATLDVTTDGTLAIKNRVGTATGNLSCGAITASGTVTASGNGFNIQGASAGYVVSRRDTSVSAFSIYSSSGNFQVYSNSTAADILTITGAGAITASGTIDGTSFRMTGNTTQTITPNSGIWYLDGTGGFRYRDTSSGYATNFQVDNHGNTITQGAIQETPTQSALDPTATNIPSGKRQGWYNSTLGEFRDWVNIGGTLLKSAAYT